MQRLTAAPQQRAERLRDSCVPWPRRGHNRARRGDEVGLHEAPTGGLARGRAREHVQERRSTARASELAHETGCLLQALCARKQREVSTAAQFAAITLLIGITVWLRTANLENASPAAHCSGQFGYEPPHYKHAAASPIHRMATHAADAASTTGTTRRSARNRWRQDDGHCRRHRKLRL
jgi:hypothetical protein